jgi:diacylglycerol kinase (ATP)
MAFRYRPGRMEIELDGSNTVSTRGLMAVVANGPYAGAGLTVAPDARLDDGTFDVCIIGPISLPSFVLNFPRVFTGAHTKHPEVSIVRGATVTIESLDGGIDLYASGERIGPLPARLETVPRALRVMVPRDATLR